MTEKEPMRTTFNNRQLAHVWAQQTQPEGRGSNFFFDGPALYSYGRHFCVARFVRPEDKGAPVVLLNSSRYSVSTGRHQSYARGAVYGLPVRRFDVPDTDAHGREPWRHERNLTAYRNTIRHHVEAAARSRKYGEHELARARAAADEAAQYCLAFKLPRRLCPELPEITPEAAAAIRAEVREMSAKRRAALKERAAEAAARAAETRAEWRAGRNFLCGGPTMLRVSSDGDSVETSRGAEVPVEDAKRVLRLWRGWRRDGLPNVSEWAHGEGPRVGAFTLRQIRADGALVIGCHELLADELERVADALGVTE